MSTYSIYNISARNAQDGLVRALDLLRSAGVDRDSRNGPVKVLAAPTIITYTHPRERVVHWPERDANPFFHLFEALWMLSGRRDLKFLEGFVKRFREYSDDGKTLHGAYGHRWRKHFGKDQLEIIVRRLKADPTDRRCVLGMWDPRADLDVSSKDLPCNTHCYVQVNPTGALDLTVCNRSNDAIWGAFGANVVHFSVLHEVMAGLIGVPVGRFVQFTQNLHGYLATLNPLLNALDQWEGEPPDPYTGAPDGVESTHPYAMVSTPTWLEDLELFLGNPGHTGLRDPFFREVAIPMWHAHVALREKKDHERFRKAQEILERCMASDWRVAATAWVARREDSYLRAQDDGVKHANE